MYPSIRTPFGFLTAGRILPTVDEDLLKDLKRYLGPRGVVVRETGDKWSLYGKSAGVELTMDVEGDVRDARGILITPIFEDDSYDVILHYFETYLPPTAETDTIQYVRGNLLTSDCDIIAHGCNCFNSMSGGIAALIARKFPEAQRADNQTEPGDRGKLGRYTKSHGKPTIFNLYTQYNPGPDIDYSAVRQAFTAMYNNLRSRNLLSLKIGIPKIGAGIAGGDWGKIESIIKDVWKEGTIYVYVYVP